MDTDLLTLGQELAEITRLVEEDDLQSTLERYVSRVKRTVPGCDHASITVGTPGGGAETVAGAEEPLLTYRVDERPTDPSPILDAIAHHEPRRLDDIDSDRRWPAFAAAMREAGYRGAIALPLTAEAEPSAVFALFSRKGNQFMDTSYDLVMLFALHAGVVFDNASLYHDSKTLVGNLREALVTRSLIGQAQGLVMFSRSYDGDQALAALKAASQHHNIKLREIARSLVGAHDEGRLDSDLGRYGLLG
ncbi:MAG: GAF and ANTAR domain-containing protein [Pseudonocardiales bacterium]|nr:GAF and ANTAR domain-containing protein [Pseudonocardiales bacterium]